MATPFSNIESVFFGVTATGDNTLDPLLGPQKWGTSVGSSAVLGFSFPGSLSVYEAGYGDGSAEEWDNYTELSFQQKGAFRDALQEFNNVANVFFSEFADNATTAGEIRIAMTESLSGTNTIAYAYYPFTDGTGGDIWLNEDFYRPDSFATITPGLDDGLYSTLLHEIGHALGLSHPFEVEIGSTPLSSPLDNMFYTIMSYTLDPTGMDYFPDREPTTLMLLDIQALQHLYGANTSYNSGNNTYIYSGTGKYLETIWDGGGVDLISYSGASVSAIIDLREGEWSSLGQPVFFDDGMEGGSYTDERTVWIAYGTEIENAFGGLMNDVILGNDLDNDLDGDVGDDDIVGFDGEDTLVGWTGNDTLDGGDGLDTAFYYGNRADYTVIDNENGTWTVVHDVVGASNEGTDTLIDIEYVRFADETALLINLPPSGGVFISGIAREDETLFASNTLSDPNGNGSVSYTWYVGGVEVPDYSGSSLLLIPADIGKTVTVTASYIDGDGYFESVSSGPTAPVANVNDDPTGSPSITGVVSGNVVEGQTLIANIGNLADGDGLGPITYTWYVGGVADSSGTTFVLTQAEVGKTIQLKASYTDQQGTAESVFSSITNPVTNTNDAPSGSVFISGTPQEDQTLSVSNTLTDEDGLGVITYAWKANGSTVGFGPTYMLTQNEVAKIITVTASYTDLQGTAETKTSSATSAVANVNDSPSGSVTISGSPIQGNQLSVINSLTDQDGLGTVTYIWMAGGTTVGSDSTYTPTQDDVGKAIVVTASYTDQQGTPESVQSNATAIVANVNDDPMGAVTISGTPEQGQELTAANTLTDLDGLGTVSYTWRANGATVGNGSSYTPSQAEVGKAITVTASYTDQQGTAESVESDPTAAVANVNDDPMGDVTLSGTPEQGQELTAANTLTDLDGLGTVSYTWRANGDTVGNDPTYTPTQDDVGKTITVTASYTDLFGTAESVSSDPTAAVANVNDDPMGAVTISGTPEQGQELTAANTLTDLDGLGTVSYTWRANGDIVGDGAPTFTPGQTEVGKTITVTAAYTDLQGTAESVASDPTGEVANVNDDPVGDVTISGTPEQYQELTASNTLTDLDGLGTISYTWKADGDTVGSGPTFIPDQVQVDETITVTASYTDLFGNPESVESEPTAPVANVNDDPFGTFTITGTAEQGQLLTASPDFDDLDGLGPLSFSWTANGVIIADAIGPSFTPGQDEVGKTIRVTATYTDGEGTAETVSSDPTAAVTNVNDEPEGAVTISGAAVQDRELTAENTLSDPDGLGTISYSWKADGDEVGTGTTFTPGQDEVGKTITVTASYTDLQGTEESVDSDPTAPVQNENESPVGAVTISGIAAQGQALTASNDLSDGDGLGEISYSWRADGEALDSNGPTFTPGQDEVGKTITVTASYTDQQGADESVDSEPTEPVANVNDVPSGTVTISGTPEQGVELTASDTLEDPDGLGTISYTWMADGEEVDADVIPPQSDGAVTGMTFTPRQSEVGKTITVTASYTDAYGTEESMTSEATAPVANVNDDPTGAVSIAGTAIQGGTLTATNTLADADGLGDVTYRWNSGGTDRGTGMTLLLTQADVGNTVTVSAAYTDLGGFLETVSSLATAPVENVNDPPAGLVLVTGTALVGETLSVSNTLSDADGLGSISYTWKADDTTVGVGDSYLLTESEVGKTITATAMYTDGGGFAEAVTSDATATVEPIEADPLFNTESFIDVADFIVTASLVRDVIGVLPGTDAGEGVIQSFNIQNGATTENGQAKAGKFGEFQLDPDTGEYRYVPILEAVFSAGNDDSEVFIISASDGGVTEYRIINVANFDNNEFIIADSNNDGLLYDAELMLQSGEVVTAADAQLYRTYAGALGRTPDVGGFDWWAGEIAAGRKVLADLGADFIWSPEFLSFFEGATRPDEISSEDFILHMYNFVFGREPDPGGFVFWTGVLDTGSKSQGQVVLEMTQSNEFVGITALAAVDFLVG